MTPTAQDYVAPKEEHPTNTIASKHWASNKHGIRDLVTSGRFSGGTVHNWATPFSHYHAGMAAGENTLTALLARLLLRSVSAATAPGEDASWQGGRYRKADFLRRYVAFMTTPGSHNDTYVDGQSAATPHQLRTKQCLRTADDASLATTAI